MKKVLAICTLTVMLSGALVGAAGACGGHRRYVQPQAQCSSTTCTVNGVCNGTCDGSGSCRWYSGCNYVPVQTYSYSYHGHHGCH